MTTSAERGNFLLSQQQHPVDKVVENIVNEDEPALSPSEPSSNQPTSSRNSRKARSIGTWSGQITQSIADEIKRWRAARSMSTQQLSDATERLGHRIPRAVLINLENARRESISVHELMMIAAALDVPPILLIAPIGRRDELEVLPDVHSSPWSARGWFHGAIPMGYVGLSQERWKRALAVLTQYDLHRLLLRDYQRISDLLKGVEKEVSEFAHRMRTETDGEAKYADLLDRAAGRRGVLEDELRTALVGIRNLRESMSSRGLVLPDLPPSLEQIEWGLEFAGHSDLRHNVRLMLDSLERYSSPTVEDEWTAELRTQYREPGLLDRLLRAQAVTKVAELDPDNDGLAVTFEATAPADTASQQSSDANEVDPGSS